MHESNGTWRGLQYVALAAVAAGVAGCDENPLIRQHNPATRAAYEQRAEGWTRWALEQPWSTGPVVDTDGSQCALGQSGNTWYLAGTSGGTVERECTIPHGKKLFFPLLNRWVTAAPDEIIPGDPENDLQAWIDFVIEYFAARRAATCELTLRIDGQDLLPDLETMDEELYVQLLEPFDIVLGADNFSSAFGLMAGPRTAWADGHWALLRPLPAGDYTLELGGRRCDDDDQTVFEVAVTYTLHVED
jgi:hypothetical protein